MSPTTPLPAELAGLPWHASGCRPAADGDAAGPEVPAQVDLVAELLDRLEAVESWAATHGDGNGTAPAAPRAPRTFAVRSPFMAGDDVRRWQRHLNRRLRRWEIDFAVSVDGEYGPETLQWSKRVLYGLGLRLTNWHGTTPELRVKARHPESRTPGELSAALRRRDWLRRLRERYARGHVHTPVAGIITSSHGWAAGHDGIDLICPPNARIFAACKARVFDVRAGGWWGKSPTGDVTRGDGIIQLEALESIGPLKAGMHLGYGHAEHATVQRGEVVEAGEVIGRAGFANAWHIHFMVNGGHTKRGIGDRDPRPYLNLFTGRSG